MADLTAVPKGYLMNRFALLLLAILLSSYGPPTLANSSEDPRPVLKTGFVEFPPFKYADAQGNASGPWVKMTERVADQAGYRLEWVHLPIARVYLYLKEGTIDLWPGVAGIPTLSGHVEESDVTPMRIILYAFHRSSETAPDSLEFLEGQPLILINGFSYMGVLDSLTLDEEDLSPAPDHFSALRMLELGRGRYVLDYDEPISAVRGEFPGLDLTGTPIFEARGAFVVSSQRPDAVNMVERLDSAYRSLVEEGKLVPLQ